ncbi:YraN family protein [Teredinibacter haidensis]|uniref:YraN family protein n=1 Tax=Teredinibacter haidensis TaxID=2731755 RepID=UPI000948A368|nr:YraN family protein [Teredinibacter haidensis]
MRFKLSKPTTKSSGEAAEDAALEYLKKKGLKLVCRNYRCKMGEIDLILKHQHSLVFVEVRMRNSNRFGSAVETVTASKQKKIISTAQHYLIEKRLSGNTAMRFDVVGIEGTQFNWIQNAF